VIKNCQDACSLVYTAYIIIIIIININNIITPHCYGAPQPEHSSSLHKTNNKKLGLKW